MNPPAKRIKLAPSFKIFESKATQTEPFHPIYSLFDGLYGFDHLFKLPIGYVQSLKINHADYFGTISEYFLSVRCLNRPPNFSRFKSCIQNLYCIQTYLGMLYGMAPDSCALPDDNPVVEHLKNPANRQNLYTCSELENVLDALATFDWHNYRQIIILLQNFITQKVSNTLFQNYGDQYQVCQSPNHYVKTLTYESSTIINDHAVVILKLQTFISGQFAKLSYGMMTVSHKVDEHFSNAKSEISLRLIFVATPSRQLSEHTKLIEKYRALHVPSSSSTTRIL